MRQVCATGQKNSPVIYPPSRSPPANPGRADGTDVERYSPVMRSVVEEYLRQVFVDLSTDTSGKVAEYIPELAVVDPDSFAICLATTDGHVYEVGDSRKGF